MKDILPTLRRLRANESHAEAIARAGRRVALEEISHARVLAYLRLLLEQISRRQPEPPRLTDGFSRVQTPQQLLRLVRLCECDAAAEGGTEGTGRGAGCRRGDACCYGYNCPTKALECPGDPPAAPPEPQAAAVAPPAATVWPPAPRVQQQAESWPSEWPVRWRTRFSK